MVSSIDRGELTPSRRDGPGNTVTVFITVGSGSEAPRCLSTAVRRFDLDGVAGQRPVLQTASAYEFGEPAASGDRDLMPGLLQPLTQAREGCDTAARLSRDDENAHQVPSNDARDVTADDCYVQSLALRPWSLLVGQSAVAPAR
jgi:hypothetical protein